MRPPMRLAEPETAAPLPLRALVVDDDQFVRSVVARQLRSLGAAAVAVAEDGAQARRLLGAETYDLIVCDLVMPGTDGIQLLGDIAGSIPGASLILMSSAEPKLLRIAEQIARGRRLRVLGSLHKPVQTGSLKMLLSRIGAPRPAAEPSAHGLIDVTASMLREALDGGALTIAVQPQVNLVSGQLEAAEALARWPLPGGHWIAPDRFLPIAEEAGLMDRLTDYVFEHAVAGARRWRDAGLELRIAVNVAPTSLCRPGLPERIAHLVARHQVKTSQILVEVTETDVDRDLLVPLEVLARLRLQGIELSIDDFGTGFSSLARLQGMPFTELKIDRSFVGIARHDEEARSIVEASVRLARNLGLRTVAEGIESAEDAQLMRALRCDLGQGYYYAHPMPADRLPDWSRNR